MSDRRDREFQRGRGRHGQWRRALAAATALTLAASLAACKAAPSPEPKSSGAAAPSGSPTAAGTPTGDQAMPPPGPLTQRLLSADLLVLSSKSLPSKLVNRIDKTPGVRVAAPLSVAKVSVESRILNVAAVDPAKYRRYTPMASARLTEAWQRVAGGELALDPAIAKDLDATAKLTLGNEESAPTVRVGAFVPQVPRISAVVNTKWGEQLKIPADNALLISTGKASPQKVRGALQKVVGKAISVQILGPDLDTDAVQTAFLTGGSMADAVGTFSYRIVDGKVVPDPAWVAENIRTEEVPILGAVTCHKVLLPQLRAALADITLHGLSHTINPSEYAGCYYPRFIANSTSMSLHAFGVAVDLNVPGNQRGTKGEMDPQVVEIFKKWGFGWGGDWAWTDPMHFELSRLVDPR